MLLSHLHTPNPPCPPFKASQSQAGQHSSCCNQYDKELEHVAIIAPVLYAFPRRGALKVSNGDETKLRTKCGCLTL
eukprot:1341112-Ditylum_brightwellii.AAC.1